MPSKMDDMYSSFLHLATLYAVVLVLTSLAPHGVERPEGTSADIQRAQEWKEMEERNRLLKGEAGEKVTVYFNYSAMGSRVLANKVRDRYGSASVAYRNYPGEAYEQSYVAAMASECAAALHSFRGYHRALVDNMGMVWTSRLVKMAEEAGVEPIDRFAECLHERQSGGAVQEDIARARALRIHPFIHVVKDHEVVRIEK